MGRALVAFAPVQLYLGASDLFTATHPEYVVLIGVLLCIIALVLLACEVYRRWQIENIIKAKVKTIEALRNSLHDACRQANLNSYSLGEFNVMIINPPTYECKPTAIPHARLLLPVWISCALLAMHIDSLLNYFDNNHLKPTTEGCLGYSFGGQQIQTD